MKIKSLPNILAVHLKRFKYQENLGRFSKLSDRVNFTESLGIFNTVLLINGRLYKHKIEIEFTIFVPLLSTLASKNSNSGPNQGHYVTAVKSGKQWVLLDDEEVSVLKIN